jgi:hypothetical protein
VYVTLPTVILDVFVFPNLYPFIEDNELGGLPYW